MALIQWNLFSKYLEGQTQINIIIPDCRGDYHGPVDDPAKFYRNSGKYKVLWLLHGTTGDCWDWVRYTNIETYAMENDLVVVMPSALNSNYTSWPDFGRGYDFPNFFFNELMPMIYSWLPVSEKREDNFIAGDSMGGNGAFIFAVSHPECFAGAGILSSCARNYDRQVEDGSMEADPKMGPSVRNAGGVQAFMNSDVNIRGRLRELYTNGQLDRLPKLYVSYGDMDPRINMMKDFLVFADTIGLKVEWELIPGYAHEFRCWDIAIQHVMKLWGLKMRDKEQNI